VTPEGSWWKHLQAKAPELASAGISAVWIPPPYKGHVGNDDVGYGVYDRYDLGEFDQKDGVATRYGTLAELLAAIDGAAAERTVQSPFPNATLVDASGHSGAEVTTDAMGKGTFPVPAKSYSLWVPKGT
jgi:hypothetical protein